MKGIQHIPLSNQLTFIDILRSKYAFLHIFVIFVLRFIINLTII